jgi:hypothetical protein
MSKDSDIDRFVKDPSLFVELCRKLIDRLDAGSHDVEIREKEAQLRAISKAIEQLEKTGFAVPETLRGEKTRLAADLGIKAEATQALSHLADEFEGMLKDLKARLGRGTSPSATKRATATRSQSPSTDKKIFEEHIIMALRKLGGRAKMAEVIKELDKQLEGKLLPGDLKWYEANKRYAWQSKTKWVSWRMKKEGRLRRDSPMGYLELNEDPR